ncbi:MAG: serine hydrolase domain-containing protein [Beijerinckiaceae bacterium]
MLQKPELDALFLRASDAAEVPGIVAVAATGREIIYEGAFGKRDLAKPEEMTLDTVFWLASMTKAVTSAAAMQLVEQGKLTLDEPIGTLLPELANPRILEGFDASRTPQFRQAKAPITLRRLLTHTAGFGYDTWNIDLARFGREFGVPPVRSGQKKALSAPLASEPGSRWEYSISIDFVGQAVETVSGKRLEVYFRDHIFEPLGMSDTGFKLSAHQRGRLVGMHSRQADGSLKPMAFEVPQEPEFHMGGGGLYGTAHDYVRFVRMVLNKGELDGNRVLAPETIALMARNHIGDLNVTRLPTAIPQASNEVDLYPEQALKWGLGFMINTQRTAEGRSAGSLAWGGLANTYYWIDPSRNVGGVILMQLFPFLDKKALELFSSFERAVYANLDCVTRMA